MMRRFSGAFPAALLVVFLATPLFAKPPDLPQDSKIVVSPQAPGEQEVPPQEPAIPESGVWRSFREGSPLSTEEPDAMTMAWIVLRPCGSAIAEYDALRGRLLLSAPARRSRAS